METEFAQGSGPVETVNFDKIVAQSEANLAEATAPKRGRGRPKKIQATENKSNGPELSLNDDNGDLQDVSDVEVIKPTEVEPLALELVKAPFDLAGLKTGIDLTPTDVEAKLPSYYLAKLIHSYLPDLDLKNPRRFNMVALAISYALLILKKLRLFTEKKREKINVQKATDAGPVVPQESSPQTAPLSTVPASVHFSNSRRL